MLCVKPDSIYIAAEKNICRMLDVYEYVTQRTSQTTGIKYITDSVNGTATITGYSGESSDVIIPSYVSDGKQAYKVTAISSNAFAGKSIRSIVIGEFINTIPNGAFKNCTALEEVIGSFTEIGNEAFAGCSNLTNMNIPSNVVKIGTNAFKGVNSINVRAINQLSSYAEAKKMLPDGTDEQLVSKQKAITQESASGQWWYYNNSTGITYSVQAQYQNRTASTVQIRLVWNQTITRNSYYGYAQYFYASCGGQNTGNVTIASSSTWSSSSSSARTVTAYSGWMTVPVSATSTSAYIACDWWTNGTSDKGSWGKTISIPAY